VHVGVGLVADHRGGLHSGGAHRDQFGVEFGRQRGDEGRRSAAADRQPNPLRVPCGGGDRLGGAVGDAGGGHRHRARDEVAVLPQRDVHRPVAAVEFGELTGAVQGVDDPDPVGADPGGVVGGFFAEHRIVRAGLGQQLGEQLLRRGVTGVLDHLGFATPGGVLGAHRQQPVAGRQGQRQRQLVVVHRGGRPGGRFG
jgi:hypothetical protein